MQAYQTKVYVYTLTPNSTIDFPQYKLQTTYDIVLFQSHFKQLHGLKAALAERTGAGFLRTQFFRVQFRADFEESWQFLQSTADLQARYDVFRDSSFLDLVVVRYTRIYSDYLMRVVSKEEQENLQEVLNKKRNYTKRDNELQDSEELKVDIAADERVFKAFDCANRTPQEIRDAIAQSKQSPYLTSELLISWAERVADGAWNNLAVPPNDFPVVGNEIGEYVYVIVRSQLAGVLNYVAGILNKRSSQ